MSDAQTKEPTYYNSRFLHGVDEKRRVQIPAKWRPDKSGTELTLMLWPQHQAGTLPARFAAGANGEDEGGH